MIMDEVWSYVVGYMDMYEVSNKGRVRSLDRFVNSKNGKMRKIKGKLLKLRHEKDGFRIGLLSHGLQKFYRVNRLVAESFLPNPYNKECVCHKDMDFYNNNIDNLYWATRKEASELAEYCLFLSGKNKESYGARSVYVGDQFFKTQTEAAIHFNVTQGAINNALRLGFKIKNKQVHRAMVINDMRLKLYP